MEMACHFVADFILSEEPNDGRKPAAELALPGVIAFLLNKGYRVHQENLRRCLKGLHELEPDGRSFETCFQTDYDDIP